MKGKTADKTQENYTFSDFFVNHKKLTAAIYSKAHLHVRC